MKTTRILILLFAITSCNGENPFTLKGMKIKQINPADKTLTVKRAVASENEQVKADCNNLDFDVNDPSTYPGEPEIELYRHCL
ncbi:MAG: hypothetical protein COW00_19555 [Bdellovibrio sp. CG12_big_fil_rev_8_21_14_0_65_39_13]|nr:MAG: hypothetical protein COW78_03705 [Bdellovibrio sp. CG22_combo_CG10-13_8_21_14_all_39_27]PIQ57684.1 MAG: hypothetical protein COW00_19555 [Bdellovibrio sp. CG12_big_fil_rev_8_21_14_0_65_39_13]PJB54165.1 MAG: hypothetical protein CO099_03060 [Bdellovibrio sp. CG_4_9_14_3_um_filter_39_7]